MSKVPFKYYLHESGRLSEDGVEWFNKHNNTDVFTEELLEKMDEHRPFYEVTVYCEVDTDTGEVTLTGAEL